MSINRTSKLDKIPEHSGSTDFDSPDDKKLDATTIPPVAVLGAIERFGTLTPVDILDPLVPIFKFIEKFRNSDQSSVMIDVELSGKSRHRVYDFIEKMGLCSESLPIKGSYNKKIILHRNPPTKLSIAPHPTIPWVPGSQDIDFFAQYSKIPIPCPCIKYLPYYLELFDSFYGSNNLWKTFARESQTLCLKKEVRDVTKRIVDTLEQNLLYKMMMGQCFKNINTKLKIDIYNLSNVGKYFLSLDLRMANFTVLRDKCPGLFVGPINPGSRVPGTPVMVPGAPVMAPGAPVMAPGAPVTRLSWYDFVKQFTGSEFIANSKYFREQVFGHMQFIKRATALQEIFMDTIHTDIVRWNRSLDLVVLQKKSGDELIYWIQDIELFLAKIDSLYRALDPVSVSKLHIHVFELQSIGTKNFFVKSIQHSNDLVDEKQGNKPKLQHELTARDLVQFKRVPKQFMPQVIKWYKKETIQREDLLFIHEGIESMFLTTIFD
jgi:hypothetical protein